MTCRFLALGGVNRATEQSVIIFEWVIGILVGAVAEARPRHLEQLSAK